jgi:outer membrane protein assembly factor BamB
MAKKQSKIFASLVILLVFLTGGPKANRLLAGDWPQWRGPNRDAVSHETGLLRRWSADGPKIAWQASGLGIGYASVVVSDGLMFTIGRQETSTIVFAFEATTGRRHWARQIGTTTRIPCSTPTIDKDRLYALDPDGDLVCLKTTSGEIIWQKSFLQDFAGRMMSGRGYGESPLIDGDKLICTPGGIETMLVALNKHTGELIWKSTMPDIGPAGRDGAGFSSVVVTEASGVRQYVQLVGRGVIGVDAKDGRFLWGYNALANGTANIPTPIVRGDLVFAANGYNAGSVLLKLLPDGKGGVNAQKVYSLNGSRFQNHHGGVVTVGGFVYGGHGSNNGLPTCLDLKTGRIVWKRRGPGIGSAAVVYADGHLYFRYQNGVVALIEATTTGYRLKGTFQIPGAGGDSWAHPAIANGRLYLREKDRLWVYDLKGVATTPNVAARPQFPLSQSIALKALRQLDVSFELLKPRSSSDDASARQRLYRYIDNDPHSDNTAQKLVVVLRNKHLSQNGSLRPEVRKHLHHLRQRFVLSLAGTRVSDDGLKQSASLPQLAGLNLELCPGVTDAGLQNLQQAGRLQVLLLTGTGVTAKGLKHLASMKNLRALDLEVCDDVTDTACAVLGSMKQLKAVVIKKTGFEPIRITDAGLKYLSQLSGLETLNLYGNQITDAGLAHLRQMKRLRDLDLSLLAITDSGLVHLQALRDLQHLELLYSTGFAGPLLTDAGLAPLERLTKLKSLDLTGARITDDGLDRLTGLKKLSRLKLIGTPVTAAGVRRLQAVLPDCQISR